MIARLRILALAFTVVLVAPLSLRAQEAPAAAHRSTANAGPLLERTATAMRAHAQAADSSVNETLLQRRRNVGRPVALMVVGGAAIIIGAVIGGDAGTLFMIGGAVAGLIGLYQYLQ